MIESASLGSHFSDSDVDATSRLIVASDVKGPVFVCDEGLSFWGGVDTETGTIIDAHHPQFGASLAGRIVLMPTSRGSCSGSGVLLELAMKGCAPAALIFRESEDVLTLGALVATRMFDCRVAVIRLGEVDYDDISNASKAEITGASLMFDDKCLTLKKVGSSDLRLSEPDRAVLGGAKGPAAQLAMEILCAMASAQGGEELLDVTRAHIDGCIFASPANLTFAETMAQMGGKVVVPTTMNAISVDRENWQAQNVPKDFGAAASRLADAYVMMGAQPTFTCAPYQLSDKPVAGEDIGWSESNAVIYANSVLGARSVKHPDFLDLFIALTGRAPASGVYLDDNRRADLLIEVDLPSNYDDAIWPLLGWLVGRRAPDRIPLLTGLEKTSPSLDELRAMCASFGTTSAAPMFHIAGITPESSLAVKPTAITERIVPADFRDAWNAFNRGTSDVQLIALGSPHFSLDETRIFAKAIDGQEVHPDVDVIITLSRATMSAAQDEGLVGALEKAGVKLITDLCWCSISEPVFPLATKTLMTNSGKYAHYAPGLCGREVRFGSLAACAEVAITGTADKDLPGWLA